MSSVVSSLLAPSEFADVAAVAVLIPFAVELREEEAAAVDALLAGRALVRRDAPSRVPAEVIEAGEAEHAVICGLASR